MVGINLFYFLPSILSLSLTILSDHNSNNDARTDIMNQNKIRILALHGKGGSASLFQNTLIPLIDKLSFSLCQKKPQSLSSPEIELCCLDAPFEGGKWWDQLPQGARSYNAEAYDGYVKSCEVVQGALASSSSKYDAIIGHSQGSILLASMIANQDLKPNEIPPAIVCNGVAWPNPYSEQISSFSFLGDTKALFIVGEKDDINPPEGNLKVRDMFQRAGFKTSTITHPGGHSVPVKDEIALERIATWLSDALSDE